MSGSRASRFPVTLDRAQAAPTAVPTGAAARNGNHQPAELLRPQLHLQQAKHANGSAARQAAPTGLGLDSAAVRQRMVARLRAGGIQSEALLQAFLRVERHHFVDTALAGQAYEDTSLPIGLSQTISKPSVVARMLSLLLEGAAAREQSHLGKVLEIGTGCGYQAAVLALLARSVVSIERLKGLHDKATDNLAAMPGGRPGDLRLVHGDGRLGHAPRAPYTSIIAAAGGDDVPQAWLDQLAEGGRLVAPLSDTRQGGQVLLVVDKRADGLVSQRHEAVMFVPLKSGLA
jgi:protein-L-isoaspartate(D-aspartate) O-methyltransferase